MKIELQLRMTHDETTLCDDVVITLDKDHHHLEDIGLSLSEAKDTLRLLQQHIVTTQSALFIAEQRQCNQCDCRTGRTIHRRRF